MRIMRQNRLNFISFFSVFCIGLLWLSTINADELDAALQAYAETDYQTAFIKLTELAENNNPEAQYHLAFMYFGGEGVTQDDASALKWFTKAAKAGHAMAQDKLAYMYLHGRGMDASRAHAFAWYSVAAQNGIFLAKHVSNILKTKMNYEEYSLAEQLSDEFITKYRAPSPPSSD